MNWPRAVLLFTLPLWARHVAGQSFTPLLSTPFSFPGSTFVLTLAFQDAAPSLNAAGFQWTLTLPAGFTAGTPTAGAASIAAQKAVSCNGLTCLAFGVNANTYASGVVATIPITIGATAALGNVLIGITSVVANVGGGQAPIPSPASVMLTVNANTGTTQWFKATVAATSCTVSKVAQTPIRINYVCIDAYGSNAGSYTANMTTGGGGTSWFYIGMNSLSGTVALTTTPVPPNTNLSCLIQMNATPGPVTMLNGVSVPANSAAYSCSGYSTTGQGMISWP